MVKRFTKTENIELLHKTLAVISQGYYETDREIKKLKLSTKQMSQANVFLPCDIEKIKNLKVPICKHENNKTKIIVSADDSFTSAIKMSERTQENILVLNFANPYSPGGGVRYGSKAQEEDLCRKSTLLLSLESESASSYYKYNLQNKNYLATDSIIISPNVEVIKDSNHDFLKDSKLLSVITCPAPMLCLAPDEFDFKEYQYRFYQRIEAILLVAAHCGYKNLVLGAFGCGAFRNNPANVAPLFKKALENFQYKDMSCNDLFRNIDFAILTSKVNPSRNYVEFSKIF